MALLDVGWLTVAVVVAVGTASAAQVISGMGFALLAGPLLALVVAPAEAVRITVLLSLVLNVVVLMGTYRRVRWSDALRLLLPAAVLVVPTSLVAGQLGGRGASLAVGVVVLTAVGLVASGRRARWVRGPAGPVAAGAASGVMNVLAGVSGPPVALLVAHRDWSAATTTATLQAYALPLNVVTLLVLGLPTVEPVRMVEAFAGMVVGALLAGRYGRGISPKTVRQLVLGLAAVGGASLIVRSLL